MIHTQNLIDDAKCYQRVRDLGWPEGVKCPQCGSAEVNKRGHDERQANRQRYECQGCGRHFDDLSGPIFEGHHQPFQPPVRIGTGVKAVDGWLLAAPLPPEAHAKPLAHLHKQARLDQHPLSQAQSEIACWMLYLTNIPGSYLDPHTLAD